VRVGGRRVWLCMVSNWMLGGGETGGRFLIHTAWVRRSIYLCLIETYQRHT
jgi:hypothetical protein